LNERDQAWVLLGKAWERLDRLISGALILADFICQRGALGRKILKDGRRAMLVTDAFMAWFLALGFTAPAVVTLRNTSVPRWRWQTAVAALVAIAAIFLFVPAFSYMLVERELHVDWPFAPENRAHLSRRQAHHRLLVVADEGDAHITYLHLRLGVEVDLAAIADKFIANLSQGQSRPQESEQDAKWSFCLTAGTLCPANQERQ
jgi:hypothetical protein